jgi:hypothetical protein
MRRPLIAASITLLALGGCAETRVAPALTPTQTAYAAARALALTKDAAVDEAKGFATTVQGQKVVVAVTKKSDGRLEVRQKISEESPAVSGLTFDFKPTLNAEGKGAGVVVDSDLADANFVPTVGATVALNEAGQLVATMVPNIADAGTPAATIEATNTASATLPEPTKAPAVEAKPVEVPAVEAKPAEAKPAEAAK